MKFLGGISKTIVILAVLGFVAFKLLYYFPIFPTAPCRDPIPYVLGRFDEKFKISKEDLLEAAAEAEKIWEEPYGKELFAYKPENDSPKALKLNLVYDYRQEASSKLERIGGDVEETQADYDALKAEFEAKKSEYEKLKSTFNKRVESFNSRQAAYEREVDSWNKKGGAPEAEFHKLEQERAALGKEAKALETMQSGITAMADEVNTLVVSLNRLAGKLNLSVDKFNTINQTRGETFEEGVYESNGFERSINIYEFSSREKLVRVLAHELGHALGLDHVENSQSIMYEYNQSNTLKLSKEDLAALKARCEAI
jgi:predicted  nucleic acid-binding Zn-ribbon protein